MKERWKRHFEGLLNKENSQELGGEDKIEELVGEESDGTRTTRVV